MNMTEECKRETEDMLKAAIYRERPIVNVKQYVEDNAILDSDDKVVVKELWDGRYRVNVWKHDPNRIVQSYFIQSDASGVVSCSPSLGA